jgi:hypothetical protein
VVTDKKGRREYVYVLRARPTLVYILVSFCTKLRCTHASSGTVLFLSYACRVQCSLFSPLTHSLLATLWSLTKLCWGIYCLPHNACFILCFVVISSETTGASVRYLLLDSAKPFAGVTWKLGGYVYAGAYQASVLGLALWLVWFHPIKFSNSLFAYSD